jgi:primary-amine oxidase
MGGAAVSLDVAVRTAHPLDPLRPEEIERAVAILRSERSLGKETLFGPAALVEPDKRCTEPEDRRAELVVYDRRAARTYEATISLRHGRLEGWVYRPGMQPALMPEEYLECETLVKGDPAFAAALRRRGIEDLELVTVDPLPTGNSGLAEESPERRMCRTLAYVRPYPNGNSYARPIEGVVGLVDLGRRQVVRVEDFGQVPLPAEEGEYRAARLGALRSDLRAIEITQPDGPSFEVEGYEVRWQRWRLRVGFTPREGLVLHTVGYEDGGRLRSILHRASYAEMAVPYAEPTRYYQAPFDIGENYVGTLANSLSLGCDCLGHIHYFDAVVSNSRGEPVVIDNAICMHEEDVGILWKHTDFRTGEVEVRRSRRLVISSISTIGNYEYGFFWYLYLDGTIEAEVKATGIVATQAVAGSSPPEHGALVAPSLSGMNHQHIFCVRLDLDIDGPCNSIYEVHSAPTPVGAGNPYGNAWRSVWRRLGSEQQAQRLVDPLSHRQWVVVNPEVRNAVGQPVGYRLVPGKNMVPLAAPGSSLCRRGAFATRHLWVTPYSPQERYPAGEYPNQHPGGAGLPEWTAADRSIEDADLVVWYTMNYHHVPRPEDWPVMPVSTIGFALEPVGFFDRNPALDVAPPAAHTGSCSTAAGAERDRPERSDPRR